MMKKRKNKETNQDTRNRALYLLIKENNLLAENKLLMENEPFIRSISNKLISAGCKEGYLPVGAEKDDLLQEGLLAMLKAAESFDPSFGNKIYYIRLSYYLSCYGRRLQRKYVNFRKIHG